MIWVYAVCDRPEVGVSGEGLGGAPLHGVVEGPLLAVVSRHDEAPEPAVEALWTHERVVDGLMAEHAVLPMRFASSTAAEEELRGLLRERRDELVAALDRVRGRVEVGVRALAGERPATAPAAGGREYLQRRMAADRAALALHEPLADLAVAARRAPVRDGEVLRASYLVERDDLARFRGAVERLQTDADVLCTGPWPPYSFVETGA